MALDLQITYFDLPERSSQKEIKTSEVKLNKNYLVCQLLESYPELSLILNRNRQIVYMNTKAITSFDFTEPIDVIGRRFGEAINCIHSHEMEAGCGTSIFCKECGAAKSIMYTRNKKKDYASECQIKIDSGGKEISKDFRVYTSPLTYEGEDFIIFIAQDIADEKRRNVLEKIFFHDVLNTAGSIKGLSELMTEAEDESSLREIAQLLNQSALQLLQEIVAQRDLTFAEKGELAVNLSKTSVNRITKKIFGQYKDHYLAIDKNFSFRVLDEDLEFETDETLLVRSLGNLIKNALEAAGKNKDVTIYPELSNSHVHFNVSNEGVIPEHIQLQIFNRSFSTKKDKGRGLGTYSVKLIIEQYLSGKIRFISNDKVGTIFTIALSAN